MSNRIRVGTVVGFQNPVLWRRPWGEVYEGSLKLAVDAEALGFDELWLTEHHFAEDGYCPSLLPVAGAIAALTTKIRIGTKVILLPFHEPVRLAEDIAVTDVLSGGRIDIGLAAGYRVAEFEGFRIDRAERGPRMEEGLEILRKALTGEPFEHQGRFHSFGPATITPPPIQQPFPLWLGGRTKAAMRRAGRFRCHLQLSDFSIPRAIEDHRAYTEALQEEGLDPHDHRVVAVATIFLHEDPDRAWELAGEHLLYQQNQYMRWFGEAGDRPSDGGRTFTSVDDLRTTACLVGTPDQAMERILEFYEAVPFTDFSFWTMLPGMSLEIGAESLKLFSETILPKLKSL